MGPEQHVRAFYGYAGPAHEALVDDIWHHDDPGGGLIQEGKQALDAARGPGVFTVGAFAVHPAGPTT
ncbi:hypothetical protein [Streptomyces chartreusis]|uniref:hypothetical protein n=1 Tax=Streptomyces chartreusis TaxID=1969 RepID=UPI0033DDF487